MDHREETRETSGRSVAGGPVVAARALGGRRPRCRSQSPPAARSPLSEDWRFSHASQQQLVETMLLRHLATAANPSQLRVSQLLVPLTFPHGLHGPHGSYHFHGTDAASYTCELLSSALLRHW